MSVRFVASLETGYMVVNDEQNQAENLIKHGKSQKHFFTSLVDETRDTGSEKILNPHTEDTDIREKVACQNQGGNQPTQYR